MSDEHVGAYVTLTLTSKQTVTGTIFAYDPENCALVVLQQPSSERPTVKIINTCFLQSIVVHERAPKDPANRLPAGVAPGAPLPGFGSESLQKKVNKTLVKAEERRRYPSDFDVTIGACQVFDKLVLTCGQATFTQQPETLRRAAELIEKAAGVPPGNIEYVIQVGEHVIVTDNGTTNWDTAHVFDLGDGHDQLVARVRQAVVAAFRVAA